MDTTNSTAGITTGYQSYGQTFSEKIIKNTAYNIFGRAWGIIVILILTPYIIGHIGVERYGIWALVGVLTGFFGLLDFGIGESFIKYIAEFYTKRDYKKINQVINTGIIFYSILVALIIALTFFIINPLLIFLNIPQELYNEASFVFLLGIIIFSISNILSGFGAIQSGLQRMDITNKVAIAVSIPMVIGTVYFLESGYGLPGLMINNAIIFAISSLINIVIAFKILPELKFRPFLFFSKEMFKKLFGFGYKIQVSKIASLIHFHIDKILLAYFLKIGFVTYYAVAANLTSKAREIPLLLILAIFPAASELEAKTDKESLYKLYFRSMKYVALIALPISLSVILLADPFMNLWLGKGYGRSVLTVQILIVGYFFNIITGPGFFILNGIGKPQYGMKSSILAAVLNLTLSIVLVTRIGYFGVVIGTTTSMIIAAGYFISMFHQIMNVSLWKTFLRIFLKPFVASIIPFGIIYFFINQIAQVGWFSLIFLGALYLTLFILMILIVRYLDDFDKSLIKKYSVIWLFK